MFLCPVGFRWVGLIAELQPLSDHKAFSVNTTSKKQVFYWCWSPISQCCIFMIWLFIYLFVFCLGICVSKCWTALLFDVLLLSLEGQFTHNSLFSSQIHYRTLKEMFTYELFYSKLFILSIINNYLFNLFLAYIYIFVLCEFITFNVWWNKY